MFYDWEGGEGMSIEEKVNEFHRVASIDGEMQAGEFAMTGLLALALVVTDGEDEKYNNFIKLLENLIGKTE